VSQFVLTISNWHFVRDAQNVKVLPVCAIKDCVIGLKLSSSAFKPQSLEHADDGEYHFDKNGLLMPYTVFLDFMSSIEFKKDFMDLVKTEYENRGNKIDNDDNESAIAAILANAAEREAEITKQREAAENEYMNTLLQARIAHGSQGDSPRLSSTLPSFGLIRSSISNNNNVNRESEIDEDNDDNAGGGGGDNDDDEDNDEEDLGTSERIVVSRKRNRKRNPSPNPPGGKSAKKKQ
jgi:hypothetical protein